MTRPEQTHDEVGGPIGSLVALSRPQILLRVAGLVYLPQFVGLVAGPVRDCGHCVTMFYKLFPIVPGILAPTLLRLEDAAWVVGAGAVTLLILGALYAALRRATGPRAWWIAGALVCPASALQSYGLACALAA